MQVRIATPLFSYTGQREYVEAHGASIGALLDDLDRQFPGMRFRIVDEQGKEWMLTDKMLVEKVERGLTTAGLKPGDYYTANDGTTGTPYILARGEDLEVISDVKIPQETATAEVGETHELTAEPRVDPPS